MDELRQFHLSLKISQVKELLKDDFVVFGDSVQDVIILQRERKMKAAPDTNVKVNLPKAFQKKESANQKSCYKRSSYRYNGPRVYRVP